MVRHLLRLDEAVLLGMCRWRARSVTRAMRAAHYPLDIAAGGALGLIAGLLARALL